MFDRIAIARNLALAAHGTQQYGQQPYSVHLDAVAGILSNYGEDAIVCAYLHDVVEDTAVSIDVIREQFGEKVAACVLLVTDEPGVNRKERKVLTNAKLKAVTSELNLALLVKAADRLANLRASVNSTNESKLEMYRGEHGAFREAVYRSELCDELWNEMELILKADAK